MARGTQKDSVLKKKMKQNKKIAVPFVIDENVNVFHDKQELEEL